METKMQINLHPKIFILPYIVDTPGGEARITLEEEIAAISCLALHRRKRIGFMTGRMEEIKAISKIYYPLVCIPWGRGCFIADGLEFLGFTFSDIMVPDMLQFVEKLRESSSSLENFMETLSYGANLFSNIIKSGFERYRISCLIGDRSLLELLLSMYDKLAPIDLMEEEKPRLIRPKLQAVDVENISKVPARLRMEVSMLKYTFKVMEGEVSNHLERLSKEGDLIMREYKRKAPEFETEISERVRRLAEMKSKEISEIEKEYEKRARDLLREREKVEKALLRNRILLERFSKKYGKRKSVKSSKVDLYLSRIEELTRRSKDLQRAVEEIEAEGNEKVREIEKKYDALIMGERKKMEILNESRDAEIKKVNEDIEKIKKIYLAVKDCVMKIIGEKERLIKAIEECILPVKVSETMIIGVPFYAIVYKGRGEERLDFHPPVKVSGLTKAAENLLKLNLESRVNLLLTPLGESVNVLLDVLMKEYGKNLYLSSEIRRIIGEEKTFLSKTFMESLRCGLERLKKNGWLSSHEESTVISFYESVLKHDNNLKV
ncbi:MAG: hypothetical protein QXX99_07700 [Candidatus Bathyarchaeia archaeon]